MDIKFVVVAHHERVGDAFLYAPAGMFLREATSATIYNDAESAEAAVEECKRDLSSDSSYHSVPVRVTVQELAALPSKARPGGPDSTAPKQKKVFDIFHRRITV